MTKLIGIKELQKNTKRVREEVEKGVHFIVVYRSKPIFEISPFADLVEIPEDELTEEIKKEAAAAKKLKKDDLINI